VLAFKRDLLGNRFEHDLGAATHAMEAWKGEEHAHRGSLPDHKVWKRTDIGASAFFLFTNATASAE
jgi:hypothetical protein